MLQTHKGIINPSIVALKPRQVMLAKLNMKHNNNNNKGSTETLGNGSTEKTLTLKPHRNSLLLHSILQYLERNGFSKTLKSFRSEAQIENDGWKGCSLDLEELCCKYLETGNHADTNLNGHKGQDLLTDGSTKKDGDGNCVAFVENVNKKRKKRSDESDSNTVVNQSGTANKSTNGENTKEILTNDVIPQLNVKAKEKKKRKKISDSLGQGIEQVSSETLKEPADDIVCELQLDESNKKSKDKKKKKTKLISESLDDNVEHQQSESLPGVTEEKSKDLLSLEGKSLNDSETNMKSKDKKKKKKNKATSDSLVDNVGECGLEDKQGPVTTKFKDIECSRDLQVVNSTVVDTYDTSLKEKNVKSKDKKKKKDGLVSESLYGADMKVLDKGKPKGTDAKTSEEAINKENKGSKKRKRLASEENVSQPVDGVAIEESKRRKTEGSEEAKGHDQVAKENAALGNDGRAGKESKEENTFGFNESQKTFIKQLDAHANGNLEKNDGEKSSVQKTMKKQHNGSVEPKTVNAFQRVKVDDVRFSDERLQDNSYWAKDGAEIGYGAKAQEVLGQVRGRDFRHEKTKKKRGSYRGGQIDLQSHSVKFDYSDDD